MIATIGEALIDLIEQPDGSFRACLGGSVCNFTLGLARQGVPVAYLNPLSTDRFGTQFEALLAGNGVHLSAPEKSACPTSLAVVGLDARGIPAYAFYRDSVADRDVDAAQLVASFPSEMTLLHTGGLALVPDDDYKSVMVMRAAVERDALTSVDVNLRPVAVKDMGRYREGVMQAMREAHLVKVSDEDLGHLGLGDLSLAELGKVLFHDHHHASRTQLVALTLGSRGAVLLARSAHTQMPAPAGIDVVDTVGAGDCFHAGLVAYLHRAGMLASVDALSDIDADCLEFALRHAIACASLNIMRSGCQPPTWEEAAAFAATMS